MTNVIPFTKSADDAFAAYCEAARRAQSTLEREDAEAAGRAWRLWLDIWMTREQREFIGATGSKVVPCR